MVEQAAAIAVRIRDDEAIVNITFAGQNAELPDPVSLDASDAEIRAMATEALRGGVAGAIPADPNADLTDFVIQRFAPTEQRPYSLIGIRPKTPFGMPRDDEAPNTRPLASTSQYEPHVVLDDPIADAAHRLSWVTHWAWLLARSFVQSGGWDLGSKEQSLAIAARCFVLAEAVIDEGRDRYRAILEGNA